VGSAALPASRATLLMLRFGNDALARASRLIGVLQQRR